MCAEGCREGGGSTWPNATTMYRLRNGQAQRSLNYPADSYSGAYTAQESARKSRGAVRLRVNLNVPCCSTLVPAPPLLTMDGEPPPEEDFTTIPISDRLAHKNWKARVSAYESLVKTFSTTASDTDPAFKPYVNNPDTLKKIATDSNAIAQEKGLECLVAFVKYAGENAARTREVVVPALVDKCLGAARAGTKTQAIELCLQYVEVENGAAGVVVRRSGSMRLPVSPITRISRKTFYLVWRRSNPRLSLDP